MNANLTAIMDGLSALLVTADLTPQNYAYPVESVTVPCTLVGYPTDIELDVTYGRGGDRMEFPLWVLVGKSTTVDARDALSAVLADATSVKSTLDGGQSFGDVRVTDIKVTEVTVGGVAYLAAEFTVEVV